MVCCLIERYWGHLYSNCFQNHGLCIASAIEFQLKIEDLERNLNFQAIPYLSECRKTVIPFLYWGFLAVLMDFVCLSLLSIGLSVFLRLTSAKCVFNVNKRCCSVDLKYSKCCLSGAGVAVDCLTYKEGGTFWLILSLGLMELLLLQPPWCCLMV